MYTHLDLFSGLGGFALAAQMVGSIQTTQFVEIDPYCQQVLAKNFPRIPIHGDITTFTAARNTFDIVSAGFPCFIAGTMVLTFSGYKPIEDLKIGDLVLTHLGRWRRVTSCMVKSCGNKLCVNPRHIYLGSHKENDNDKDQHGTRTRGVDRWNNVLTENQVLEICELLDQGFKHQDIAVQYGVSREAIGRINTGGTWGWLTRRTESNIRRKVFLAISPIGEVVEVHDMSKFIKEYGFCRSSVCRVLNGTYTQHKGWVFRYKR